ncbi:hypothetical protein [Scytonema sp. UIC 10036]|nr:hypothetical protein [Scytonema sp. UIC 10036]
MALSDVTVGAAATKVTLLLASIIQPLASTISGGEVLAEVLPSG